MARVLILQNTESASAGGYLTEVLDKLGHHSTTVDCHAEVLNSLKQNQVDLIFIDADDCAQAVAALTLIKNSEAEATPVVVASGSAGSDHIIETMRLGAVDHLHKPVATDDLRPVLERALARPKNLDGGSGGNTQTSLPSTGSVSRAMRQLTKLIGLAAACDASVLIQGETGSGKDTVARAIHKHSRHGNAPLTVIDCTAVPEDYESFESLSPGARGTVILDEIGDLNTKQQALLMRALKEDGDEKPRIIATTQYDLINMVKERAFREDLFFRLNVLPIQIPPLRERGADLLVLAETFLEEANPRGKARLSSAAAKAMLDYAWPGNVRELQNLVYHLSATVRSPVVEATDLPAHMRVDLKNEGKEQHIAEKKTEQSLDYYTEMNALEKSLLERALAEAHGNRAEAARLLGINRQLLYAKLKTHALMSD